MFGGLLLSYHEFSDLVEYTSITFQQFFFKQGREMGGGEGGYF